MLGTNFFASRQQLLLILQHSFKQVFVYLLWREPILVHSLIMRFCLIPALFALATNVRAAPYVVTNYVVLSVYTNEGYTRTWTTISESLETYTRTVQAPAAPVAAITTITTNAEYTHVTVVEIVVPTGSRISAADISSYTSYVVPITYRPDATCTGQSWTFTSTVPVYVPDIVSLPASVYSSATTYTYPHYNPSPTTQVLALLNPTDVNEEDLASASSAYAPRYMSYCYTPTTICPTASAAQCTTTFVSEGSTFSSDGSRSYYYDDYDYYTPLILICVLVPVGWWLIWLIIGLWENWMSFKGIMLGQHRKRGLPYSWCCICWLFLCFVGPTYKAKSAEEQAELLEKWNAMKKREKLKLWLKFGFRWKYPGMIGPEPEIAKRALRKGCL